LISFYGSLGLYYNMQGKSFQGLEYAEKALESAQRIQDPRLSAILAFDLCAAYNIAGQLQKAAKTANQAINLIENTHSQSKLPTGAFNLDYHSALYAYCGHALGYQGYFKDGQLMCEKGLCLALKRMIVIAWPWHTSCTDTSACSRVIVPSP